MILRVPSSILLLPLIFGSSTLAVSTNLPDVIEAKLVSEQRAIVPGQPFTVGLHLRTKPGWHTYWENPGDVGIPPMFRWHLAEGWHHGPVQYQAPQLTKMFDIVAHGFLGTNALHLVTVTPPNTLPLGTETTLTADVTWMVCGRTCHPGTYRFHLTLPIQSAPAEHPGWRKRFDNVRRDHPRPHPAWTPTASRAADRITLTLTAASPAANRATADVYYYGLDKQVFSNRPHRIHFTPPDTWHFDLPVTDYGPTDKPDLEAVLHHPAGWLGDGSHHYLRIRVPFSTAKPPPSTP